jgi:hypothetical protein
MRIIGIIQEIMAIIIMMMIIGLQDVTHAGTAGAMLLFSLRGGLGKSFESGSIEGMFLLVAMMMMILIEM